jgi:hypothetical protein
MDSQAGWRKSRRSNGQGACVELGNGADAVLVRDTKQAHMPDSDRTVVPFSRPVWKTFVANLK